MRQVLRSAFDKAVDDFIMEFVSSVEDDRYLLECDIRGSLAHTAMLEHMGLLKAEQAALIRSGLEQILAEGLQLRVEYEDVHMNVEKRLEELIGADALLLHTARSRNDQVALDLRLYVAEQQRMLQRGIQALCTALVSRAERHINCVMPGYTHMQRAQVIHFSHALLAFHDSLLRDYARFERELVSPLGACALAGTSISTDPAYTAQLLGASRVFDNSIDAVSDRDFAADFIYACALSAVHLSQLAENLILWCSQEFNFIRLPDDVTTGSSIMPQKKNPDCLELVRGKTGQFIGELVNILTTLKALPLGYNRDLQETKPAVIRVSKALMASLKVCTIAISKMEVNREQMLQAAKDEYLFATDIVELLVDRGVPFREAHRRVASVIRTGKRFSELTRKDWQEADIPASVVRLIEPARSASAKRSHGGTSPDRIKERIKRLKN